MAHNKEYWEEVRNNAAINALNGMLSSSLLVFVLEFIFKKELAEIAVKYANELVKNLKKEEEKDGE